MFDLVYDFKCDEKISITKDLIYKNDNGLALKMDVFYANKLSNEHHKTVILIHGSAPIENIKDVSIFQSWCKLLATNGMNAIVFNWRPDENKNDVESLIEFIRSQESELDLNCDQLCVLAFSAGVEKGIERTLHSDTGFVEKLGVYYGKLNKSVLDFETISSSIELYIAMGAEDDIFASNINDEFIRIANIKGWKTTKFVHPTGEHAFDAFNPGPETDLIIEKTINFLKS